MLAVCSMNRCWRSLLGSNAPAEAEWRTGKHALSQQKIQRADI